MGVYLRSYSIPVPLIVVVGAWHIIFVRALPFMFVAAIVGGFLGLHSSLLISVQPVLSPCLGNFWEKDMLEERFIVLFIDVDVDVIEALGSLMSNTAG